MERAGVGRRRALELCAARRMGLLGRGSRAGCAVGVARGPACRLHRPQGVGALPSPRLRLPRPPRLGATPALPARLGSRPGRLRHDRRVRGRSVRLHRPGERRSPRVLASGHGDLALRDRLPGPGGRPLRGVAGALLVEPAHGGSPLRRNAAWRALPRLPHRRAEHRLLALRLVLRRRRAVRRAPRASPSLRSPRTLSLRAQSGRGNRAGSARSRSTRAGSSRPAAAWTTTRTVPRRRDSGFEEAEHRKHAAVVVLRDRQVELGEDVGDVLLDRALADHE